MKIRVEMVNYSHLACTKTTTLAMPSTLRLGFFLTLQSEKST